jgi:hypothetical protein
VRYAFARDMSQPYQVTLIRPPGDTAVQALRGTAEAIFHAMRRLGHRVRIDENSVLEDGVNIVLGAHLLDSAAAAALPADTIIVNTEPLDPPSAHNEALLPFLTRYRVWEYEPRNVERLARLGNHRVRVIRAGWLPELERVVHRADKDIDVLFYGELSPHRRAVLERLETAGRRVVWLRSVYGAERDTWIARAKLVLNLHYRPGAPFEIGRVAYLLSNRCAVVCEADRIEDIEPDLRDAVVAAPSGRIPARCADLLGDDQARAALAARGYRAFRARDFCATIQSALAP